jgi:CBS domain-containing protein
VSFQYELLTGDFNIPDLPDTHLGLAISSSTPIEVFETYQDICDFVMIMTTTPGKSGGQFDAGSFRKIREFRNRYPGVQIHVDGGVNDEVAFILRILGVQAVVSGSYLMQHSSTGIAMLHLRSSVTHSDFKIRDFMISKNDAPIVRPDPTFEEIIRAIEEHNQGWVIVPNRDGTLRGIVSNADIRKGLLHHIEDLNKIQIQEIINTKPTWISEESSISNMLHLIQSKNFLVSFLPVLDAGHKVTGAVTFINLIRSES